MSLKYLESKFLYLTSANRNSGQINDFTVFFPNTMFKRSDNSKQILKINLQHAVIYREWYNIFYINNSFKVNGTSYVLPDSNPSVYDLRDILNNLLASIYTVSYSLTTNKYTFTVIGGTPTFQPLTCGTFLGLKNNTVYTGSFTSEYPINMEWENALYLSMDTAHSCGSMENLQDKTVSNSGIIAHIPISSPPFDNIVYNSFRNTNESMELAVLNGIDQITFKLMTNRGRTLDLNHNYNLVVKIESYSIEK